MALEDLIDDEDTGELVAPEQGQRRMDAPVRPRRRSIDLDDDAMMQLREMAQSARRIRGPANDPIQPVDKPLGLTGTIREGAKGTLRALGATVDTMQGDAQGVVEAAQAQANAPKDPDLERFYQHIEERKQALGDEPSLWEGIKAVGGAAIENPRGFGLMIAEQLPNSGAALGAGAAGALAGSFAGPIGATIGGLAGLATANIGLETGHKALEAGADMEFTPEEQSQVRREGLVKGGVITGIDAATLGLTNFITRTSRRAVERATIKTLADRGVDVASDAARRAAMQTPEIAEAVRTAQEMARRGAETLGKRLARTGGAAALETVGEGAGEYLGELSATGKANAVDAVIEGFAGLGTSIGEITATSILNRRGLNRLLDTQEEAEKTASEQTKETGVEHEVIPSPTEPEKFVAVPKTRTVSGIQLERDGEGNLKPVQPKSTQTDFNLANKPEFEHTAEDRIRRRQIEAEREAAYARNPIVVAKDMPPTIAGRTAGDMTTEALEYAARRGSERAKKIATDELAKRAQAGNTAKIPESAADKIKRIVGIGSEKAQEDAKKIIVPSAAPKIVKPATAPKVEPVVIPKAKKAVTPTPAPAQKTERKVAPIVPAAKPANNTKSITNSDAQQVKKGEPPKPAPKQKEPWEMSSAEWNTAVESVRPETAQSKFTKSSGSQAVARIKEGERLRYGVTAEASEKIRAAQKGEIKLSKEELDSLTDRLETKVSHADVIRKAIKDGKPVPASVIEEYPELKRGTHSPSKPSDNASPPSGGEKNKQVKPANLMYWVDMYKEVAKKHGKKAAEDRARATLASQALGRGFGKEYIPSAGMVNLKKWLDDGMPLPGPEPKTLVQKKPAFSRSAKTPKSPQLVNVESVAKSITAKWKNAPDVVIVQDMNDKAIPEAVRAENQRQLSQGATGEPEGFIAGNKVYLVASQLKTPGDVTRVLLHESLGHFGLRGVFGQELNTVLKQVAALRRSDIETKAKQYGLDVSKESDRLIASEEVLAELAQSNPKNSLVQRAFAAIRKWLRENIPGFQKLRLSDAEIIEGMLVPARRFVIEGGTRGVGRANTAIMFSRGSNNPTVSPFRDRIDKITDSLIYNFQDRFKPLKDIQKRAGPVSEDADAALAEERYSGTVRARLDTFNDSMRDPLLKAIHASGVEYEKVEEYLHALHAPSRNRAMQEINPTESELKAQVTALEKQRDTLTNDPGVKRFLDQRRKLRQAEADIEDGIADESLASVIRNEIARLRKERSVKDYADTIDRLKALRLVKPFEGDNTALSGMSDAKARQVIAEAEKSGKRAALDKISGIINQITARTREIYVEGGLEKADAIEAWNRKYENYVPLHRDEVGGNTMPKVGQGFNIKGKESKRATGSTKEVTDILAHVVAQHEAAIIRSEKARVDRALFQFASMNPDPALWTLDNAPMLRTVDPVSGFVVERVDPTYKNRPEVLTLKIDGEEHTITFNEQNPEAMRLAASMKNLASNELGEVTQMVGRITRFLATMNTTANPVFVARNFMRDLQTAFVNLSDTEIAGKKREVFRNIPDGIRGMWNLSRGRKNSRWAKYAQEFKAAGGQTGWMEHYKDIGTRADALKKELAMMQPGKLNASRRALKSWWGIIEDANNAVENGARLSAYVAARQSGLSEGKAASLAKNLTVNFNARGAKSVELNAWYMFMNASIQGTARLIKALSNQQVRKIVAGVVLSGFLMDILARAMAGDDDEDGENDYDQLPEHTKAMNFVFMVDGQPVTIPMPYGYNFFASAGRKVSEMIFRENYSAVRSAADLANVFIDAFSPTGQAGSALQFAAPTVADPFVQWAENKNFAGNPLRREQHPFGVPNPEYQMGFKSTSAPAKWLAESLNTASGGNEVRPGFVNVNPAFFDFAVSSIAGGAGRTYLQVASGPLKAAGDDKIQAREVPFLNIFVGARPEYQTERKYFEAVREVEMAQKEMKTYREKGDIEMARRLRAEHGAELRLKAAADEAKKILSRLRKMDHALDKVDVPDKAQRRRELEERKRQIMARFNRQYREAVTAEP